MDPSAYVALGIAGLVLVATIGLGFWTKSLSDRCNDMSDQLLASARDSAQKTLDAERAKTDLVSMTAERDRWQTRANALDQYIANAHNDSDAKPLPPDDLLDRVVRVSSHSGPGVPATRTPTSPGTGSAVPGPKST